MYLCKQQKDYSNHILATDVKSGMSYIRFRGSIGSTLLGRVLKRFVQDYDKTRNPHVCRRVVCIKQAMIISGALL